MYKVTGSDAYQYEHPDVFRDANPVIMIFDVTHAFALAQCAEWLDNVAKYVGKSLPGLLFGNKHRYIQISGHVS
jgi:hypothetical protein